MEPFNFLAGNEDGNIYQFDMRKMDMASKIHKGHIGAVLSIDFNPSGF
jgi:WD repeat and SOF domain-containing protein 1